jgi:hypothetical protein
LIVAGPWQANGLRFAVSLRGNLGPPPRWLQRARAPSGVFEEGPPRFRRRRGRSRRRAGVWLNANVCCQMALRRPWRSSIGAGGRAGGVRAGGAGLCTGPLIAGAIVEVVSLSHIFILSTQRAAKSSLHCTARPTGSVGVFASTYHEQHHHD